MNARSHRVEWPGRVGERPGSCRRDLGHASGARYQVQDVRPTRRMFSPLAQRGLNGGLCNYGDDPEVTSAWFDAVRARARCGACGLGFVLISAVHHRPGDPPASQRAGGQVQVDSDSSPSVAQSCLCHSLGYEKLDLYVPVRRPGHSSRERATSARQPMWA
jgi:hypothetical protein